MKNNNLIIIFSLLLTALIFSCSKSNDIASTENQQKDNGKEDGINYVPYFEVAKGDTISKGIFREKPEFKDDVKVLYSSESDPLFRAADNSSGVGYIFDLMTSVRCDNSAPASMTYGGRVYNKISVDLNEGAGGKWIYLYYTKTPKPNSTEGALVWLEIIANCCAGSCSASLNYVRLGTSFANGNWTDLNEGAGGYFIFIQGITYSVGSVLYGRTTCISDILIISSTSSMSSYPGWKLLSIDLNKGAGGSWIYLCYK